MSCVSSISYDNQGNLIAGDGLTISYTSFRQPSQITRGGNRFSFSYGAKLERLKEVPNGTTTYEIDKLYEEESNGEWRIYLQDIAIIKYDATNQHQIRYTHKDRLGSTLTYSDHNGQVTDRRMLDAFGKPRATEGNSLFPARLQSVSLSRNGFTEHRHLDEVELIHMNGRAYDYNLGRFLSVDPIIQSPGNSQSLNPYSYIMNNPLAGTDPTGYMGCAASRINSVCERTDSNHGGYSESFNAGQGALTNKVSNTLNNMFTQGNGAQSAGSTAMSPDSSSKSMDVGAQKEATKAQSSINASGALSPSDTVDHTKPTESEGWTYVGKSEDDVDRYKTVQSPEQGKNISISAVNDNIITPTGLIAGYVQNKTAITKRRWSDKYRNHGKIWDNSRLIGNYAFVAGSVITAGTTVADVVNMRNSGKSLEAQVLRGADGVIDIAFGMAAFFGPVGWGAAAIYYGADYLSGGNLTEFIYRGITGRREDDFVKNQ